MTPSQIGATAAYPFAYFGVNGTFDNYVWCFHRLAELGFENFNLEILEDEQVDLFTPERVDHFRRLGEEYGIKLPIFTAYYAENDLVSLSPERRKIGLEKFRFSVETAKRLGSTIMNMASEFPPELVTKYRSEYVHSPADEFWVPLQVSWQSIWDAQVQVIQACADMAAERGMTLSLEPRAKCIVSTTDSFLRLADHVDRPNFGCSLDIMHTHFHHEDIPTSIKKLDSLLIDIQIADADGQTLSLLPIGKGNINFPVAIRALNEIDFQGILGLGILVGNIDEGYLNSRLALEDLINKTPAETARA